VRVAPPLYSLAPRPEVRDPTPYPPLASKPDPSELLAPLPRVTPLPEAPVIILAPSAPVPLTEPVPPPVQAKIPEATIPPADPPRPPALPERTKLVLAPSLPPPPMPPPPPKSSSAAVESFLQCVCKCTSKHASPSRARRLIAALSEQLDLFEAALSDAALLQHLAGLLAESEQHYEVLAPATQLGQLVGDLEPEFAPLDLPSANAEACWALAATQRRLSPANAVLFDALAALLKEHPTVGLHVRVVVSGAEAALPPILSGHFLVEETAGRGYFDELRRTYLYVASMRARACATALEERGVERRRILATSAAVSSPARRQVHMAPVLEARTASLLEKEPLLLHARLFNQ